MKLIPNWMSANKIVTFDDKAENCIDNAACDPRLVSMQESIAKNAEKSHKWYTISEFARWATFFILGGIGTALTQTVLHAAPDSFMFIGGLSALSAGIIGGAVISIVGSMISNKIYTQNQVNTSIFNARATAREIENVGKEKAEAMEAGSYCPNISEHNSPSNVLPFANASTASPVVESKGLEYLHALMDASPVQQKLN